MGSGRELGARAPQLRQSKKIYLRFRIPYYTQWGQSLAISGSDSSLGSWNVEQSQRMTPVHEGDTLVWELLIAVPDNFETQYKYCLVDAGKLNLIKWEAGSRRSLTIPQGIEHEAIIDVHDSWQDGSSPDSLFTRSAFGKVIFGKGNEHKGKEITVETSPFATEFSVYESVAVRFKVNCSRLESGQSVCVSGSATSLGKWVNEAAVPLHRVGGSLWQADIVMRRSELPLKYRYFLRSRGGDVIPELGTDRSLNLVPAGRPSALVIVTDGYFRARPWKGTGVAVPVFSLRSTEDVGCGEFLDLKLLVDLAVTCGMRLVQLLPINDTSVNMMWWDSYPYSSLSVFALHPLYLRLQALSKKLPEDIKEEIEDVRQKLNLKQVDYEATLKAKLTIARKVFELEKDEVFSSPSFQQYFDENQGWLKPYAAFCFLRDLFGTADHSEWGRYSSFTSEKLERLVSPTSDHYNAIAFCYYLQYQLHSQMTEAAEYARANRVVLKGDLPIGVDRNCVDTWVSPTLFRMNTSTGAPPDAFDKMGQNWGFPTYNWEEMAKDNYAWWRARLNQLAKYFSAFRIDHVLGFFRIWELPDHAVIGLAGRFRPSIPISAEELEKEGIWDFNRLTEPYVRCHLLKEKFGDRWIEIANKYFDETQHLCYQFKSEYNTEKKIAAALKVAEDSPEQLVKEANETRKLLFELFHEVVLLKDGENPRMFYPRFGIWETASLRELDDHSKDVLKDKYEDYFYRRQETIWRENALKTLRVLVNSSDMLACGEDLGMVPACVAPVLEELCMLGLRVQRMPSGLHSNAEFGIPSRYEYMTVCAASCHDTSTLREWWEEDEHVRGRYYKDVLGFSGTPPDKCDVHITHTILQQHLESPSVWAIFPLQDFMALKEEYTKRPAKEERINDPSNSKHYWRFRVHVTLEKLLHDRELIRTIREMNVESGRAALTELSELPAAELSDIPNGDQIGGPTNNTAYEDATIVDSCHAPENVSSSVTGKGVRDHRIRV